MARPNGRPSKLSATVVQILAEALAAGMGRDDAGKMAGIHRSQFYRWLDRARAAREAGRTTAFTALLDAVERAEADAVCAALQAIHAGGANWEIHAAWLENKRPREFGRRRRQPDGPEVRFERF